MVFQYLVQFKMKKIILVKYSLHEMTFNPSQVTLREVMNHQCDYSLLDICFNNFKKGGEASFSSKKLLKGKYGQLYLAKAILFT